MPPLFTKLHGLGNDYIVIEGKQPGSFGDLGEFAKRICERHYGAGADGIAVLLPTDSPEADFRVRIFNPDGSEAGLSGNGTRCAAAFLHYTGLWEAPELRLLTRSGIKRYFLRGKPAPGKYVFDSELGQPLFDSASIPILTREPLAQVVDYPLVVEGSCIPVTALRIGNPNCCLFVSDFNSLDWRNIGRSLENHKQFPERTNVIFINVIDRSRIELRIWERGVGETTASGTCSCAAAVASMLKDYTNRQVTVLMPGGEVSIQWREDNEIVIHGSAAVVYKGDWLASDL
ncbi:MAG TPA: diaminopimelate epimerase [Pyrinomonadaceae bacterium]|nr:diaminopimelate epimerase [Pyrinomonadaceae bacterium]